MPFPDAPAVLDEALAELTSENWERAIELLAPQVENLGVGLSSPDWHLAVYFVLGVASVHAGQHREAVDFLSSILDEDLTRLRLRPTRLVIMDHDHSE